MSEREIVREIRSWTGTRWMHGVALKGYATDCIQFIVAVAKTFQWIPGDYQPPAYNRDYALHNSESLLQKEIEKFCMKLNSRDFHVGDILLFKYGRCAHHAGIYIGNGRMVHAHIRNGVEETEIKKIMGKYVSAWRVIR